MCFSYFLSVFHKHTKKLFFRHTGNGAVLARCSQPEVGWLGWRSPEDEDLLKAIADACAHDRQYNVTQDVSASASIGMFGTSTMDAFNQVSTPALTSPNGSVQAAVVSSTVTSPPLQNGGSLCLQPDSNGTNSSGASSLKDSSLPEEVHLPPQGKVLSCVNTKIQNILEDWKT